MNLWSRIKKGVKMILGLEDIESIIHQKPAISTEMFNEIQTWTQMYEGRSPWLKNPSPTDPVRVVSLGLPSLIASEKARMAVLEMESEITAPTIDVERENPDYVPPGLDEFGNPTLGNGGMFIMESKPTGSTDRADFLNDQYKKVLSKLRTQLEYACAKGGIVIKPYLIEHESGYITPDDKDEGEEDALSSSDELPKYEFGFDFVQADRFYPMAFNSSGDITEAAFIQTQVNRDKVYTRVEYHKLEGRKVIIQNFAFVSNNTELASSRSVLANEFKLGKEIPLTEVAEWASLEPYIELENMDRPLFAYLKMPEANTIDTYSPIGVSVYSRVVPLIRDADEQYSRLLWEFEGGELAIDVDRDALRINEYENGDYSSSLPTKQQRLFRKVDLNSEETYEVFSPQLRDESLINGLNTILTRIEDMTGLSRGTISQTDVTNAMTATELKILKQRSYQSNHDLQNAVKKALEDVVYAMDAYCSLYDVTEDGKYEISFEFDDSILVDSETELEKRMTMLNAGITSKVELRMWYFGETENQAKEALQKIDDEKKQSMETNIMAQQQLGEEGQGKDFSGDNNNPGNEGENAASGDNKSNINSKK